MRSDWLSLTDIVEAVDAIHDDLPQWTRPGAGRFENAATRRWLEEAGIATPGWESYIDAVLGAYLNTQTAPHLPPSVSP